MFLTEEPGQGSNYFLYVVVVVVVVVCSRKSPLGLTGPPGAAAARTQHV